MHQINYYNKEKKKIVINFSMIIKLKYRNPIPTKPRKKKQ